MLKSFLITVSILLLCLLFSASAPVDDCACRGIPLYGRVRIVEHHADFDVRIVKHHADIHVLKVEHHPTSCGRWQFVDHHEDFTIRFVNHHEDFTVKYVTHHPGMP